MASGIPGAFLFGPQKYKLTLITRQIFLAHACLMVAAFAILGSSVFMDIRGVVAVAALDLLLYFALRRTQPKSITHTLILAWFLLLFVLPRLTAFLLFPAEQVTFPSIPPLTADEIATGMMFIVPGTAALLAGFWFGGWIAPRSKTYSLVVFPLSGITFYWLLSFAAAFYIYYLLQINIYGDPANWGSPMGWLAQIFNTDAALLALICWVTVRRKPTPLEATVAAVLILMWLMLSLWFGSRGGPLRILLLLGITGIAVYGDFALTLRRFVAILVIAMVFSAITFPVATIIRTYKGESENPVGDVVSDWMRAGSVKEQQDQVSFLRWSYSRSPVVKKIATTAAPIVSRLGLVDYPLIIINREPNQAVIDRYLSPVYSMKKFLNNMVPGDIFPNNDIMSSRVFTMAYRGYTEEHVRSNFLSEPWTIWGYAWLLAGPVGGLLLIAAMAAIIQAGFHIVCVVVGPSLAPYAASAWLFLPCTAGLLQVFGLDHGLTVSAHFYIALGIAALCMLGGQYLQVQFLQKRKLENPPKTDVNFGLAAADLLSN